MCGVKMKYQNPYECKFMSNIYFEKNCFKIGAKCILLSDFPPRPVVYCANFSKDYSGVFEKLSKEISTNDDKVCWNCAKVGRVTDTLYSKCEPFMIDGRCDYQPFLNKKMDCFKCLHFNDNDGCVLRTGPCSVKCEFESIDSEDEYDEVDE
jgi:hypothetical protein